MIRSNQYNLELLIKYYQDLIAFNDTLTGLDCRYENHRYNHLISQLNIIKQAIINKDLTNLNALYVPIRELFLIKKHFSILEEVIEFYKRNTDVNYDVTEAEQYLKNCEANSISVE